VSELQRLVDVRADGDSWIGAASGPAGKRAFGGQFAAQALAAAWRTVDADRLPTNMQLQYLRGGDAGEETTYTVTPMFDGRTASARRVDAHHGSRLLNTSTVSFALPMRGPEHGRRDPGAQDPEALPQTGPRDRRRRCRSRNSTSASSTRGPVSGSCGTCGGGPVCRCPTIRCCTR